MTQSNVKCPNCGQGNFVKERRYEGTQPRTTQIAELFSCGHLAISLILPDGSRTQPLTFDMVRNPVEELEKAYKEEDYIKIITYGCAVIEYYGKRLLIRAFKNRNIGVSNKKIARLGLDSVLIMLLTNNLIDKAIYDDINKVKKFRNDIMHIDDYPMLHLKLFDEGDNIAHLTIEGVRTVMTAIGKQV